MNSISSTSVLENNLKKYGPNNLFDNKINSWCEGKKGDGIGEGVAIQLKQLSGVARIFIKNGYGDEKYYSANNRVKALLVNNPEIKLKDDGKLNAYILPKMLKTDSLDLKIKSVYKGDKWEGTCMSETSFKPIEMDKPEIAPKIGFPVKVKMFDQSTSTDIRLLKSGKAPGSFISIWGCKAAVIESSWRYTENRKKIIVKARVKPSGGKHEWP